MVTNLIHLGDKVDIRFVQQVARVEQTGVSPRIYKSQVNDIKDDGSLEITMPIENGKVVLLPLGVRFEFVFYTGSGLYHSIGQIRERYKQDNIFVIVIELHSAVRKISKKRILPLSLSDELAILYVSKEDGTTKVNRSDI